MTHIELKELLNESIKIISSDISQYALDPCSDFIRTRKLPPDILLSFLISEGSSTTKNELLDFFDMDVDAPSSSAFCQQRGKLKPEGVEALFHEFTASIDNSSPVSDYRFLAADGSTATFFSKPKYSPPEYFVDQGHSAKGFYSIHINALYDLDNHTYVDAFLQPVHEKDEFKAFTQMVDRYSSAKEKTAIFIGDRGYCSYNNMAHVIESGQYFLFRAKDIHSKGILSRFDYPKDEYFDITVKVTLVRSNSKSIQIQEGYRRFIDEASAFDYIEYGSHKTYELSFRIVRFALEDGSFESLVTNLPEDEFPANRLKEIYYSRWGIETSFRKLKYTIGLSNFHSYKPEYVKQEIWARLIAYNATETLINSVVIEKNDTKHEYAVNFSVAAHICRIFIRITKKEDSIDVMSLLEKELIPIRKDRRYNRLKTAHFRKPRHFIYRAS